MPDYTILHAKRVCSPDEASTLIGDTVPDRQPTVRGNVVILDADTGRPVAAQLKITGAARLRQQLHTLKFGTLQRSNNYNSRSQTFGYRPRRPLRLRENCDTARATIDHPDIQTELDHIGDQCAALLADYSPELVREDRTELADVLPEWKMGEAKLWTSGVINDTAQLPYHRDNFNYPVVSAMPVLRRHTRGGHLHLPEYDLVLPCQDSTASFFKGKELVHGVTPITRLTEDSYRYSIVFYALQGMKDCFTHAQETARGQRKRTERERAMAQRLANGDYNIPT
ncbi:hypothetical protein C1Y63_04805 [Corynebacterium sp. 13CS0277]|uniref:hypothetical protein n=1 Tax=Corynebacterium sp. 13CS0277 TaxID=2071994 RepID=UPI000D033512|nr:hypothetical protein [Corynebacterium sp. 13CS0277]PRQ11731.1 hypothetical protein C1Y63_04805 [Corynebacterium sp. 13CS0277]